MRTKTFSLILIIILLSLCYCFANADAVEVKDYIKGKFSLKFVIYLSSLDELDQNEKEFIDLLEKLPEETQEFYAKEVYSKGFNLELLEKIRIGSIVNNYYLALNNREWDKARSYCIEGSAFYHFVSNVKEAVIDEKKHSLPGPIFLIIINNVTINDNYASIEVKELTGEEKDQEVVWGRESKMIFLLGKLNGNWKLSKVKKDK